MKSFVGNDLIDFAATHNRGRARQPRFLERILTNSERARMALECDGDYGFALLWSGKEAAYKAAKKHDSTLVFAPRRWQVEVDSLACAQGGRMGSVAIAADTRVSVRWHGGNDWLHCVALLGEPPHILDRAVAVSTELEPDGDLCGGEPQQLACRESAAVRTLAERLLQRRGVSGIDIRRAPSGAARMPPRIYAGELALPGIDLSLSHDGRFVAAVITMDEAFSLPLRSGS